MVPTVGFELTTYRLQGGCSTPELCGRGNADFRHVRNAFHQVSTVFPNRLAMVMVLLRGIEPPTY